MKKHQSNDSFVDETFVAYSEDTRTGVDGQFLLSAVTKGVMGVTGYGFRAL